MTQANKPTHQLPLTEADKVNLIGFLNKVPTTGLREAELLLNYASAIKNAPPIPKPEGEPEE